MGLLSKKDTKLVLDPLADNNPITIQVLGICSALAITAELKASLVMAFSVLFVLGVGNVVISLLRNVIPSKIRIIVQFRVIPCLFGRLCKFVPRADRETIITAINPITQLLAQVQRNRAFMFDGQVRNALTRV